MTFRNGEIENNIIRYATDIVYEVDYLRMALDNPIEIDNIEHHVSKLKAHVNDFKREIDKHPSLDTDGLNFYPYMCTTDNQYMYIFIIYQLNGEIWPIIFDRSGLLLESWCKQPKINYKEILTDICFYCPKCGKLNTFTVYHTTNIERLYERNQ